MNYVSTAILILTLFSSNIANAHLTRAEFEEIGDRVAGLYADEVQAKGSYLSVEADWEDQNPDASMLTKQAPYYRLFYTGGWVTQSNLSLDALSLILCHEIGHLLGSRNGLDDGPLSSAAEGEADYFATNNCLKKLWKSESPNVAYSNPLPEAEKAAFLKRIHAAGISSGSSTELFALRVARAVFESTVKVLKKKVSFSKKDRTVVSELVEDYPSVQCRLDTYTAGLLGLKRPLCWYKE